MERVLHWNSENLHYLALVTLDKSFEVSRLSFSHLSQEKVGLEKSYKILDKIEVWSFNLYSRLSQMKMMIFIHFDLQMVISYGSTYLGSSWPIRHEQPRGSVSLHLTVSLLYVLQLQLVFLHGHKQTHLSILHPLWFQRAITFLSLNWRLLEKDSDWHGLDHTLTSAKCCSQSTITSWKWITFLP